jgi:hypothetical protein
LIGFEDRLDEWQRSESADDDLLLLILPWIMSRSEDPYQGMKREPEFENLWFGPVPNTEDGQGNVVACSYWVEETNRCVRCDSFATLSLPL